VKTAGSEPESKGSKCPVKSIFADSTTDATRVSLDVPVFSVARDAVVEWGRACTVQSLPPGPLSVTRKPANWRAFLMLSRFTVAGAAGGNGTGITDALIVSVSWLGVGTVAGPDVTVRSAARASDPRPRAAVSESRAHLQSGDSVLLISDLPSGLVE